MRTASFGCVWLLLLGVGCDGGGSVSCGPGTVQMGDQCVAVPPGTDAGPPSTPPPMSDAGPATMPPPDTDAGPDGWSTLPPGTGAPPGCDEAAGECDAWEQELHALIEGHAGRGCAAPLAIDPAAQAVADAHAAHQASLDMITASSPDGDLFGQMRAMGAEFMYAGALFSVTREGASDVMSRWVMSPERRAVLDQCWTIGGVAVATSETGASYVTVVLGRF